MKKLLLMPILFFLNLSVSQENNQKLNKIFNPEQEAILTTKQLSLRLDLTNLQEEKIITFLKSLIKPSQSSASNSVSKRTPFVSL